MNIRTNQPTNDNSETSGFLPSSDAATYFHDKKQFPVYLNTLVQQGDLSKTIGFLEVYFAKYPLYRQTLVYLHSQLVASGEVFLAREVGRIYAETCDYLLEIGKKELGLPAIFDSNWALGPSNLYEIVDYAAYTYHMGQIGLIEDKPVLLLANRECANEALIPYLEDIFEVITDGTDVAHYERIANLSPFNCAFYKISATKYGAINNFYGDIYPELIQNKLNTFTFTLKPETYNKASGFLKEFGLKEDEEFIVLNLNEDTSDSDNDPKRQFRNVNPLDYVAAIEWLLSQGVKVVRIGHPKMTPLPEMNGLIDLTAVERPGEVDIYLCAQAKFYYGTFSGPMSLSTHFGTKVLVSNSYNYGLSQPNTLIQFCPMALESNGRIVLISELESVKLDMVTVDSAFTKRGLKPISLTSDDHLSSVKDMIEFIKEGDICLYNDDMKMRLDKQGVLSNFTYNSLKLFENSELM